MTVSLAQGNYCDRKRYDPEDPRCAHIILTGRMEVVEKGSREESFARKALFDRHPEMPSWPEGEVLLYLDRDVIICRFQITAGSSPR